MRNSPLALKRTVRSKIASREGAHIPPNGKKKIIDSKVPISVFGYGIATCFIFKVE